MKLESSAFADGDSIPAKYTADGKDISPPLSWTGAPDGVREFALIMDDPDAPTAEPWVHWVIYRIAGDVTELPEDLPNQVVLSAPPDALQGVNTFSGDNIGYGGPAPPQGHGPHRYHFKLYALDSPLDLPGKQDKKTLLRAMDGHILAEAELMGTYER